MSEAFDYQQVIFGARWDLQRSDRNLGGLRLDLALKALESHQGRNGARVLEAGCGVGRFTEPLRAHPLTSSLAAFDLSQAAVSEAHRRGCRAEYAVADVLAQPYAGGKFDAVFFFDLLEHLEQPEIALAEIARVTAPGGLLHGYVPCEGQPPVLHWLLGRWVHSWTRRHAGHVQHYRHRNLLNLIQDAGFEIRNVQYSYHLVGQTLDVVTFAVREMVHRRRCAGSGQPEAYYDRAVLGGGGLARTYGMVRRLMERAAYVETRLLHRWPWALGVHISAVRT
jgi:2-polyprenyl-3-methyl-5-hydroxy-6-metoxy-1,4-benzoquinol methylase